MLIAVVGTRFSGVSTVESYLVRQGFTSIRITGSRNGSTDNGSQDITITNGGIQNGNERIQPFSSLSAMLDFCTRNWRSNFVTTSLQSTVSIEPFVKRPFFLLLQVDAPLMTRFRRSSWQVQAFFFFSLLSLFLFRFCSFDCDACTHMMIVVPSDSPSLEEFVLENDALVFGSGVPAVPDNLVTLNVLNSFSTIKQFEAHLDSLDITNPERLRPGWDTYFMMLASLASQRSNCMKRRVGAVLVRGHRIVATGYNGTPRGLRNCNEGGCSHCNDVKPNSGFSQECVCLHAEENALLEAGRDRVGSGAVLYCNTCPCLKCTIKIIQTGVKEVVYNLSYKMDDASANLFYEAGVQLRRHAPPPP